MVGDNKGVSDGKKMMQPNGTRIVVQFTCSEKNDVPIAVLHTIYHTVPRRGSRPRPGHRGVLSTVMGIPCGRSARVQRSP